MMPKVALENRKFRVKIHLLIRDELQSGKQQKRLTTAHKRSHVNRGDVERLTMLRDKGRSADNSFDKPQGLLQKA